MGYCGGGDGGWEHTSPTISGYYEVRPCVAAWGIESQEGVVAPSPRLTFVDVASGRFDAGPFGGDIAEPLWEWRGPIEVPSAL